MAGSAVQGIRRDKCPQATEREMEKAAAIACSAVSQEVAALHM